MQYIINADGVLSSSLEGPLAPHLGSFAQRVSELGYALDSLKKQVRIAAFFSRWLAQNALHLREVSSEHAQRFLQYRSRQRLLHNGDAAALRRLIEFLRLKEVIPAKKVPPARLTAVEQRMQDFERYLRDERVLARATIVNYVPFIRDFLQERFGDGQVNLSRLRARDVVRFVRRQALRLHMKRAKLMTSALRSFLQYTRYRGEVTLDLAAAVPVVANWSMTSVPRAIAADQVRQLLASVDQSTPMGRRDYAIVLLLARLGLRSGEAASLELDDIDWTAGLLSVRGKSGRRNDLPLPTDVGKAIAAYLRRGRPPSTSRRIFLRAKAPIRGFLGASGVGSVVRHCIRRAGIEAPTEGAHQFRHGLAAEMLRKGASLAEIGDLLGHRHPQTTMIYTKVDLVALRSLALPWPGGVS
ncbi:MAG TPA: site-specific integrase [Candidatus Eremiobacteraceae bacterium]|nr:site-specific integrase [Candidatus Eremiobacteraceae bacterium]